MASMQTNRYILDNGLTVLLREVHTAPIASSWLWYRVGSRNEGSGITGASHWAEHMMFKGTPKYPKGAFDKLIARNGGSANAFTDSDYTCYFVMLPADKINLALDIEADRMANALFAPEEVASERSVIISEREGLENYPDFLLAEEVAATAFKVHPYHHEVIGWKSDLRNMNRDQLFHHYRTFYSPNNAVLSVAGDFDSAEMIARITNLFGGILRIDNIPPVQAEEPPQKGERRVKVRQAGPTSYVQIVYHTPDARHRDAAALTVLDAIFAGAKPMSLMRPRTTSRSARLYRALVESELASDVSSSFSLSMDPGLFSFDITVRPERSADEAEAVLLREVEKVAREGISEAELEKARKQTRAQMAYSLESVANQACWLGLFEVLDSYKRFDNYANEISAVSCEDVQRVAAEYLREDNRTVGQFIPTGNGGGGEVEPGLGRSWPHRVFYRLPKTFSSTGQINLGPEQVARKQLDNGAVVLAYRNSTAPSLVVVGNLKAGALLDSAEKRGLAAFTGSMLERGNGKRTFQQVNEDLDAVGASMHVGAGGHTAGFVGKSLVEDADLLMEIISDCLRQPAFPEQETRKLRGEILADLKEMEDETGHRASLRFREMLYPESHPYHYRVVGYSDTVAGIGRADLDGFYQRYYDPRNMTVTLVGDMEPQAAIALVEHYLGAWQPQRQMVDLRLPPVPPPSAKRCETVLMADKVQSDIAWGGIGLERTHPDYYPLHMADVIWGQLGMMGRLGEKVRDEMGLAYYVYSRLDAGFSAGPWCVRAGVNPSNVRRALDAIEAEARRLLQELVSEQELQDAQDFLIGSMPLQLETNEGLATTIMGIEQYNLGLDYVQRYPDIIRSVTREQILETAQRYLLPDVAVCAIAGPEWR